MNRLRHEKDLKNRKKKLNGNRAISSPPDNCPADNCHPDNCPLKNYFLDKCSLR